MVNTGVITKGIGGLYSVYCGGTIYNCGIRGAVRLTHKRPLIGDRVIISEIDNQEETAVIDSICDRKNAITRPAVANVDAIAVVIATLLPQPDLAMVDKMLINARLLKVEPVIIINKADQSMEAAQNLQNEYANACRCFVAGIDISLQQIAEFLQCRCTVLAGQSGVGKSTLLNRLLGQTSMETGLLSEKTQRGKHTTRHSEIFLMKPEGLIIDSPGFSLYEVETIEPGDLQTFYPEVYNNEGVCRFPDCSHTDEPDCFVKGLVGSGHFAAARYERYCRLYKEMRIREKNKYR